jgi:hypothetical protein
MLLTEGPICGPDTASTPDRSALVAKGLPNTGTAFSTTWARCAACDLFGVAAERDGKFYLIQDESTWAGLLDEEDLEGLDLVTILEFPTHADRAAYVRERGWDTSTDS